MACRSDRSACRDRGAGAPAVVDLVVRSLEAPDRSGPGRELKVSVEWENVGDTTSSGAGVHRLILVGEAGEVEIARWMGPALAPGATAVLDTTLALPDDLEEGAYALRVQLHADAEPDSTRADNVPRVSDVAQRSGAMSRSGAKRNEGQGRVAAAALTRC